MNIQDAKLLFEMNFLSKPTDIKPLILIAKNPIIINSFNAKDNIHLYTKDMGEIHYPLYLKRNESILLYISNTPNSLSYKYREVDTISINTSDTGIIYKIMYDTWCSHLDQNNINKVKELVLSKSKDGYLFIKGCGSVADFDLIDSSNKIESNTIVGGAVVEVNLSNVAIGKYTLIIRLSDCDEEGVISLIIKE
ncbi:MAG: hypothetical protein WCG87_12980 [Bacteroidota bacterium]